MYPAAVNHSTISRGALLALAFILVSSCAVVPADLRRVVRQSTSDLSLRNPSLGELLELALEKGGGKESVHALGSFVEEWKRQLPGTSEGHIRAEGVTYQIRFVSGHHGSYPLSYFDSISPAADYRVKKIKHHRRGGIGTPLVAFRANEKREPIETFYPPEGISRPLTAVIGSEEEVEGIRQVEIQLLCPLQRDDFTIDGETQPLAADFTVPWAAVLSRSRELIRLKVLDPLRREPKRDPQLYLMEPYDPNKEPLILIHGLFDTPLVWARLSNELWSDDSIRQRYQIWHYLYNTSAPALYSGRILRKQLREVRALLDPDGRDPAMRSTTVIAHSMGGIVTRSLLTRPGDVFWDAAFTRSIESLDLSDKDRDSLRQAFFWEPETHVKRVIYIAVPHLGSADSYSRRGRLAQWLVRPPNKFAEFYGRISAANPGAFTPQYEELGSGKLDSVHALSPEQPTLKILAGIPDSHPVKVHSIIGNRGLEGLLDDSSDGTVEYWSSHLEGADTEKIIPSDHQAVDHPEATDEIKRLLNRPRGR
ncbi:MAG: pimeloyl-ACP methyl ester carboxylesterase [Verrucomicrobiales bacterium]